MRIVRGYTRPIQIAGASKPMLRDCVGVRPDFRRIGFLLPFIMTDRRLSQNTHSAPPRPTALLLSRLLRTYVWPYLTPLIISGLLMAITAAATGANAWLLQPAIDEIFIKQSATMLWVVPLAVILVAVVKGFAGYGETVLMHGVGQRVIADVQADLYRHLIHADIGALNTIHSGRLLSVFLYDTALLRDAASKAVSAFAKDFLTVVALTIVMFVQDWRLALMTLFVLPLAALIVRRIGKRMRKASSKTQEETGSLSTHITETLTGADLVKAETMEEQESLRARQQIDRRLVHILKSVKARAIGSPSTEALSSVAVGLAILYGGWQAQQGALSLGAFMSFLGALLMSYQPLKRLATLNAAIQEGLAAADRIFQLMDHPPTITEADGATGLSVKVGNVRLDNVHFAYGDRDEILHGISLEIPAGATVALVGASGAGKSSLLHLLLRFYDCTKGAIYIDDQPLTSVTVKSLRDAIALVSQRVTLFDDTVRANIAYGRRDVPPAAIEQAARAAAAHDFISALPQGYDTIIGENGVTLSGGQRQRLAIARAMLKNAPILLLDEATAALDTQSERQVQLALNNLMQNRTVLVIAHRLSTVTAADCIYVLDKGRIVESGTHRELLQKDGAYKRLYDMQFDTTPDAPAPVVEKAAGEAGC